MKFSAKFPQYRPLILLALFAAIFIIINPYAGIDVLVLGLTLLIIGHVFLKEKLLLAFLIIRPTLDLWRDVTLFQYKESAINLNAAFALLFLVWSFFVLFNHRKKISSVPLFVGFACLMLVMFASAVYGVSSFTSLIETTKFINIAAIFALSYISVQAKFFSLKELLSAIVASAVLPLLFGALQIIGKTGISTFDVRGRIFGTFAHPNVFAFFILTLLFLHTQFSAIQKMDFWKKNNALSYVVYAFLLLLLVLTYTRAALVGLFIFLVIIGVLRFRKMLVALLCGVIGFYLIFFPINDFLIKKTNYSLQEIPLVARVTSRNEDADSFEWRRALIRENIPIIRARPLFGYGYGTFPKIWEEQRSDTHLWDDSAEAHNDYLRLAVEIGLAGLTLYVLLLLRLLYITTRPMLEHKKVKTEYMYMMAWVITFLALSFTDNMLHHTPVMWMTFALWGAVLAREYKEYSGPNFVGR